MNSETGTHVPEPTFSLGKEKVGPKGPAGRYGVADGRESRDHREPASRDPRLRGDDKIGEDGSQELLGTRIPRKTKRGTPCARSWDDEWIAQVEEREETLDRRICGARTLGGIPCTLVSTHPSGRCRHHGGFDLTGAPEGNRNAQIHGLYSRRLMVCGSHCPAWQSCPCGGAAPDQGRGVLKLTGAERPQCPYELAEYNAVVTDTVHRVQAMSTANAFGVHLAHTVALLTVMTSRAAKALAFGRFTDKTEASAGESYYMSSEKPSAALIAYEKLSRELRRWVTLVEREYVTLSGLRPSARERAARSAHDTAVDPDSVYAGIATAPYVEEPTVAEEVAAAVAAVRQAMKERQSNGKDAPTPSTFSLEKEKVEPKGPAGRYGGHDTESSRDRRDLASRDPRLRGDDIGESEDGVAGQNLDDRIESDEENPNDEKVGTRSSRVGVSPAEDRTQNERMQTPPRDHNVLPVTPDPGFRRDDAKGEDDARATSGGLGLPPEVEPVPNGETWEQDFTPKARLRAPRSHPASDRQSRDGP